MAKQARRKTSTKGTNSSKVEPKTSVERDREKYGDVLYAVSLDVDEDLTDKASRLYGAPHLSDVAIVMVVLGIIGLVVTFALEYHNVFLTLVSLLFAVTGSTATGNWHNIQAWALMGTNMGASKEDIHRHEVVTSEAIIIEGPGAEVATYPLSQLKRVRHDEHGCLASFGKARVAYFPLSQMSSSRLRELERYLESRLG